ncbi:GroES-like protein [Pochonia chlamydosporia 170]|uniref:GroES-like protein n=1 Tax=Pochonia chlamydosporia 170 TaxID=1380566 RepID=A0A179FQ52_METCM|nr:GroES-like protein [Pochonia chlamydosporia 170]OAQ67714.1 GroES-like protein [Pochonia chlamydosporia 170]
MRALILTKPPGTTTPVLSFTTTQPVPVPGPDELLVRIHASAIQPSDLLNARGEFGTTTFPRVPGRDFSGVIASGDQQGTPVFGSSGSTHAFTVDGFQAEYAVVPAKGVVGKPDSLTHVQAATLGVPFTTAALIVEQSGAKAGDKVLVLGANGAVGKCICVLLEEQGCTVLRAVRGPAGDVDTKADPDLRTVRSLAPSGVHAAIDTVGVPSLTRAAVEVLGHGGRLVFITAPRGPDANKDLSFDMLGFYREEKSIVGVNSISHSSVQMAGLLEKLDPIFASGRWKQAVSSDYETVRIEDAVEAYANHHGKKFVITMN